MGPLSNLRTLFFVFIVSSMISGCGARKMAIEYKGDLPTVSDVTPIQFGEIRVIDTAPPLFQTGEGMTTYIDTISERSRHSTVSEFLQTALEHVGVTIDSNSNRKIVVRILRLDGTVDSQGMSLVGKVWVHLTAKIVINNKTNSNSIEGWAYEEVLLTGLFSFPWKDLKPLFDRCTTQAINELAEGIRRLHLPNTDLETELATATSFAVNPEGWLITAYHVIESASKINIRFDTTMVPATVVATDQTHDLALLRVGVPTPNYLQIADMTKYTLGQEVYTLGYPLAGILTNDIRFNNGTISALSGLEGVDGFIQISVPIQPGNSGGPLMSAQNKVVGVVVAKASDIEILKQYGSLPENIAFAIDNSHVQSLLDVGGIKLERSQSVDRNDAVKAIYQVIVER